MQFTNLVEMVKYIDQSYNNPKFLNHIVNGNWESFSSAQFCQNLRGLALALNEIGLKKENGLGIIANSSPIWLMMNLATIANGAISVPIFANISTKNLLFEIDDSDIEFFFCDSKEGLQKLLDANVGYKKIITYGFKHFHENRDVVDFYELLKAGEDLLKLSPDKFEKISSNVDANDVATIIYTSGSTGVPKGVEITHHNLVRQIMASDEFFPLKHNEDVALSFLPLAHIFEGMVINLYMAKGISIYFADDVKNVGNLLKEIKPTLMTVVPRMLEKTYNKMLERLETSSFIKKVIGRIAYKLALNTNPDIKKIPFYFLFNNMVYKKLTEALGGNLKMMICGGAPLAKEMEQFFINIGIKLYSGYGLTESSPVIAVNCLKDHKIGTVGKKFPEADVRIIDGELFTRGPYIMKGYHQNKGETRDAINEDGWLKTGDLASIDGDGFITITGRKKELFKTAYSKYVSPVPIEQKILQGCSLINAALIIAEGRKCVTALLFIDFENIVNYKNRLKLGHLSDLEFLDHEAVLNKIKRAVDDTNFNLNNWEQIKDYKIIKDEISIENGDLTPSMKLKRNALEEKYKDVIEGMYKTSKDLVTP